MTVFYTIACEESKRILEEVSFSAISPNRVDSDLYHIEPEKQRFCRSVYKNVDELGKNNVISLFVPVSDLRTYLQMVLI